MKFLALMILLVGTPWHFCQAEESSDGGKWDLGVKLGLTTGKVFKGATSTTTEQQYDFSGVPVAVVLTHDLSELVAINEDFQLLMDLINKSISRIGLNFGASLHLLGGERRLYQDFGHMTKTTTTPYALSLLLRAGLHLYGASSTSFNVRLDGIVLESAGGLSFRFDLGTRSAVGFELYRSLVSLGASSDRIRAALYEGMFYFRTLL